MMSCPTLPSTIPVVSDRTVVSAVTCIAKTTLQGNHRILQATTSLSQSSAQGSERSVSSGSKTPTPPPSLIQQATPLRRQAHVKRLHPVVRMHALPVQVETGSSKASVDDRIASDSVSTSSGGSWTSIKLFQ